MTTISFLSAPHGERSSLRHGLHAIEHHIQHRLLDEIGVHFHRQRAREGDQRAMVTPCCAASGAASSAHLIQNAAQVGFLQMQIARPGEIHQNLHHPVQAVYLAADNVHVAARIGIDCCSLSCSSCRCRTMALIGIFDFVRHATRDPPAGGEPARHFDFVFNAAHRLCVAQGQQRANLALPFLNKVKRNLDRLPVGDSISRCERWDCRS